MVTLAKTLVYLQPFMNAAKILPQFLKIMLPITLGGAILWWMYRGMDFEAMLSVITREMDWTWMLLSFPFGILAQAFRAWRWKMALEPVGEKPRSWVCMHAVALSYASSLVIPRVGEFLRCTVLKRYDGVSFPKALGTVVTERTIDSLIVMTVAGLTLIAQMPQFLTFFRETGTSVDAFVARFSWAGYFVTAVCGVAALLMVWWLLRRFSVYNKVKDMFAALWQGVMSLRNVRNVKLLCFYSIGIWMSYFLHYYLTFYCFGFTENLGMMCALVTFVVGTIAVIVPTPNGAGPWHFAVKTMLILYGVADEKALWFVLIVHSVQTLLVVVLGVVSTICLAMTKIRAEHDS